MASVGFYPGCLCTLLHSTVYIEDNRSDTLHLFGGTQHPGDLLYVWDPPASDVKDFAAAMTIVNTLQYVFPCLVVSIAVVLLCFYLHARKKRAAYDVTVATAQDDSGVAIQAISASEGQEVPEPHYDRLPPRYSTIELPPPYELFDPKLTSVWPGGPPPAYEMYPITLPLAPHYWMTPSTSTHVHPPPQRRHHRASFG